jgi:hypothetical protein
MSLFTSQFPSCFNSHIEVWVKPGLNTTVACAEGCYISGNVQFDVHLSDVM